MEMELAKLTSKGQLTIPVAIRKKLSLKEGDKVLFLLDCDGVRIANASTWAIGKAQNAFGESAEQGVAGMVEKAPVKGRRRSISGKR